MSSCVENGCLDSNCVEGGSTTGSTSCDFTNVLSAINSLDTKIDELSSKLDANNLLGTSTVNKITDVRDNMVTFTEFSNANVTIDQLQTFIVSVDDVSINVLPNNTEVYFINGNNNDGIGIIRASRFVPHDKYTYDLIYDVELKDSNPIRISSIPSIYVVKIES